MKKKLLGIIAVVAIVASMAINLNFSAKNNSLSDLSLANIEALAKNEGGDACCYNCWRELNLFEVGMTTSHPCTFDYFDTYCPYGFAFWPCG